MPALAVKLAKGSHVYASINIPENGRGAREVRLLRGGVDVTEEFDATYDGASYNPLFSGLPEGSYQLRVLSTAEIMRKYDIKEWKAPESTLEADLSAGVDCKGITVDFTIDAISPPLLDLGELVNEPVEAMKEKAGPLRSMGNRAPR
jgi:hypothetical protein